MKTSHVAAAAAAILLLSTAADAQRRPSATAPERPEVLNQLTACRAVSGDAERLACYDRQVAALEEAERTRAIAVVDRQQIRRTRRSLFGLTLPDLGIFGGDEDEGPEGAGVNEITSTLSSIGTGSDGRQVLRLSDNSVWVQTDGRPAYGRSGEPIRIRRGALGSFIANINNRSGIRVVRLR